jgi:DNA polymerase type B, organellar and viral
VAQSSAARVAAYRARQKAKGEPDTTRRNRRSEKKAWKQRRRSARIFTGCDGEGAGTDELGRQNYLLFRMGERELYTGARLRTEELLEFICDHPRGETLVGFFFGYDVTMILRDLPDAQKARLFEKKTFGEGKSPYVWFQDFDIDYLPKQYFRVRRIKRIYDPATGRSKRVGVPGSARTIYETAGFFQKSFLKVIEEFNTGTPEERELIRVSKLRRGDDEWQIDQTERDYCAVECRLLADLMEQLKVNCEAAGILPRTWNGAGKLAKALLASHDAPRAKAVEEWVPQEVRDLANMAYYGGRFEITRTGNIKEKVYEYDIGSAYPDAMRQLPCLKHGFWMEMDAAHLRKFKGIFVAAIQFKHDAENEGSGQLGTLPIRSKEGHLYWPLRGAGVYWSHEIRSAERRGCHVRYKSGWTFHTECDCKPFDWIEPLFDYRKSIGKSGPGYPIKLGLNSLYGAQAQRVGTGQYANMVYAGLTTAITRARLNDAIALAPGHVVMVATDAVYAVKPLPLALGDKLGDWELAVLEGLFIVQPGLYWCPERRKRKSRGLSGRFFEEPGRTESFENAWQDYMAAERSSLGWSFPAVSVPVPGFIGLKLAQARGKPQLAGTWVADSRLISFDYSNKRSGHRPENGYFVTGIKHGSAGLVSLPHRDFLAAGGAEPWEAARLMLEEQPEFVDLGPPKWD